MKTLLLLRHAKSSWQDERLSDFDRPLAPRGEREAPRIGKVLKERGVLPDLILCSPAVRAKQTVALVAEAAELEITPQFEESLYGASAAELLERAQALPDSVRCALFVGHNPGMEQFLFRYTGATEPMTTAALACITFAVDRWKEADADTAHLAWRTTPKHPDHNS